MGKSPVPRQQSFQTWVFPIRPVKYSRCLSADGLRFLGHPIPARTFVILANIILAMYRCQSKILTGLPRSTCSEMRLGRVSSIRREHMASSMHTRKHMHSTTVGPYYVSVQLCYLLVMVYQPFHHLVLTTPTRIHLFYRSQSSSRPKSDFGYQISWTSILALPPRCYQQRSRI